MNLFLGGAISERICQSSITDHAENYFSEMLFCFEEVPDFMKTEKNRTEIPYTMPKPERS